ncbi:MAG: Si-specific NAD(P)(+) transhydrogenase [Verrucomicrobia bacterium]|nr:Si-specific NAD(P)(+) transhydrogenase [Verrucomicrobiota bacterium]
MEPRHYDLVVIGSGPAGEKGAAQAAYFGKKVALIEKQPVLGGAAANTGTLPSKTLRESALYLSGFRQRGLYGITFSLKDKVTARDFLYRERLVVQSEQVRIAENLKRHKVDLYSGFAAFEDAHTISITPQHSPPAFIRGDIFLIATGSHPHHPANLPFHNSRVYDSDTILNIHDIPPTMLIAGGGVIGCEYACMFAALGIRVSLVEGRDRLLGFMDPEVSQVLASNLQAMGIELHMNDALETVTEGDTFRVQLKSGKTLAVHTILAATGRTGNTHGLGLEKIGVQPTPRGHLEANEHYQTSQPHIYAVGDVIGFPALASTSMEQARVAMVHAFDLKYKSKVAHILPYGIYTIPECSMAGETEETLAKKKIPYVCGRAPYSSNARGQIIGDKEGFIKLIFHEENLKLLGVHVIGEQASELVHVGLMALLMEATADLFIQTCFNYPTLTEIYKYATYDALGNLARRKAAKAP